MYFLGLPITENNPVEGFIYVAKCSEVEKMKGFTLLHRMSSKANWSCQSINKKELEKIEVIIFFLVW